MTASADVTSGDTEFLSATPAADWWRQAVVYQIYPRSFADADGDGLGDIRGVTSRADYLHRLGIDAVWLSPFYPSALADGGYDVADYRDVDPRLGTLADFDDMVAALHERGIKVLIDIVPNHTSNLHPWFQEAVSAGRGAAARQRYIFRDGRGPDGSVPPSDWVACFGGPAWTRVMEPDGTPGQWYLHTFAVEQPDLNWSNPEVREYFQATLRFWADRGVDGFRVDAANLLTKDLSADPLPSQAELDALPHDGSHPINDRDDVQDVYAGWRQVFNSYNPPRTAVAEAWVAPHRVPRYASPGSLGQAFNFDLLKADFNADQFRAVVTQNLELAATSGSSSTWVLSNHDVVRHATRYGLPDPQRRPDGEPVVKHGGEWLLSRGVSPRLDREQGVRRARAATLFVLALPGSTYLYQGEELGLHEVWEIPDDRREDPTFFHSPGVDVGRDGARVPLPWTSSGTSFGFGTDGAHLPQPAWFAAYSVEAESADPASTLSLYRAALHLRRKLEGPEDFRWVDTGRADVLRFARPGGWEVITTFGPTSVDLGGDASAVVLSSIPLEGTSLPGEATAWIRR